MNKNRTVWFKHDEIQTAAQQSRQDSLRLVGLSLTSRVIVEISSAASRGALVRRLLDRQTIITNAPTFDRYELIANFCDVCVKLSPVRSFWKYSAFSYPVAQTPAEAHRLKPTEYLLIFYCWVYLNFINVVRFSFVWNFCWSVLCLRRTLVSKCWFVFKYLCFECPSVIGLVEMDYVNLAHWFKRFTKIQVRCIVMFIV